MSLFCKPSRSFDEVLILQDVRGVHGFARLWSCDALCANVNVALECWLIFEICFVAVKIVK